MREIELRADARVTVISERRRRGPYGLAGGGAGAPGENLVRRTARSSPRRLPGKFQIDLGRGAVLTVASPGGGGHGRRARRTR
jgi:N-methylhydantoinase B